MRDSGFISGTSDDNVIRHRQQTFPLAPRRDLRPRVRTHDEKQLARLAKQTLKGLDRIDRVAPVRSVEFESRNRQLWIVLRRECQHRVAMYRLRYRSPNL